MRKEARHALLLVIGLLGLAVLACTSDQEWIIPRTPTPTPTPTPVPITAETRFQVGDQAVVVAGPATFQVWQTSQPEPDNRRNRVVGTQCFPGQTVEILDVAQGPDGNIYYYVDCILEGWIPEENLEPLE